MNKFGPSEGFSSRSDPEICVVGTGAIANDHLTALDGLEIGRRSWVVSRRPEPAEHFAKTWDFPNWTTDFGEALSDPAVDVVLITSPSPVHAEQAERAVAAGKDVIVEIPAGVNLVSIDHLVKRAREGGRRCFACHTMRSFAGLREIRDRVRSGGLTITQVSGVFAIPRRRNQGWTGNRSWVDDLLWHHACHQIDATLWVVGVGEVADLGGIVGRRHPEVGMHMDLAATFSCDEAIPVTHSLTYNCDSLLWELRFTGLEDVVTFRNGRTFDDSGSEIVEPVSIRDLTIQNAEIFGAWADGKPSTFDLENMLPSYRILQSIDDHLGGLDD